MISFRLSRRAFSTSSPNPLGGQFVKVSEEGKGIHKLVLSRKPVNSLGLDVLNELNATLTSLEQKKDARALIISSDIPGIFSAGLDITEMYRPKRDRVEAFWRSLQSFFLNLYLSRLVVASAIQGQSPAGGCLISCSSDIRVMANNEKYRIGLNETQLGIVAPFWFMDAMVNVIGFRQSEKLLQLGVLVPPSEAHRLGLVDHIVPESEVEAKCKAEIEEYLKVPDLARALTKKQLRQPTADRLKKNLDWDVQNFVNFVSDDKVQKGLELYLEKLKAKK
eukprot:TRINITY_DN1422_c0_g1_i2.p1 TRINITY_DN1422_c0_g1~~TRINITY_DN1422_c0_g1_i2.p1  ORF type:complete len:278 (-),score=56.17 TRINITY_DN1422_c0_g1_i2:61-894(-)